MRQLISAVVIAMLPAVAAAQTLQELAPLVTNGAEVDLDKAILAFRSNELDRCLELLESARKTHPNLPPARLMFSRLHLSTNLGMAKQQMEVAAGQDVGDPEIYFAFGLIALAEGRQTDARVHFERALSLEAPTAWPAEQVERLNIEAKLGLSIIAENQMHWKEAETLLAELNKLAPNTAIRQRLARAKFQQGRIDDAMNELKAAVAADPKLPPPDVSLAALYASTGKTDKALEVLKAGARAAPTEPRYARELATIHMTRGENDEAEAMARRALQLGDKSPQAKMTLAMLSRRLKKYDQAIAMLEAIRHEAPTEFEVANQLALVMLESGTAEGKQNAVQMAEANMRLHSQNPGALSTLGWIYFQTGRTREGEQYLRAAASQRTVRTETAYFMAQVLTRVGKTKDAEAAKAALRKMMKQPGLFVLRAEATKWLADNPSPAAP